MEVVDQGSDTAPKGVEAFGWREVGTSMRGLMLVEVVSRSEASGKKKKGFPFFFFVSSVVLPCTSRDLRSPDSRLGPPPLQQRLRCKSHL